MTPGKPILDFWLIPNLPALNKIRAKSEGDRLAHWCRGRVCPGSAEASQDVKAVQQESQRGSTSLTVRACLVGFQRWPWSAGVAVREFHALVTSASVVFFGSAERWGQSTKFGPSTRNLEKKGHFDCIWLCVGKWEPFWGRANCIAPIPGRRIRPTTETG